jgi:tricorn protease
LFPALYQHKKIGALVGSRVPGTGTAVMQTKQLEPRLAYTIPVPGFRFTDSTFFENREIEPDILVCDDPNSVAAGLDLQLERTVEHLFGRLKAEKP